MSLIAWNDRLLVGVPIIDSDHKRLISLLNDLFNAIERGDGRDFVGHVLDELHDYTHGHFAREEALFMKTPYPAAAAHRNEHDRMRAWVAEIEAAWREGTLGAPSLVLISRLKDWLFDHILGVDQQMVPFLYRAGLP